MKWSYMDHWRSPSPNGPIDQWQTYDSMDRFLKQVAAVGYDAIDTFDHRYFTIIDQYGSVANYQEFVQERGLERIVNTFHAAAYDQRNYAPHIASTHDNILEDFRVTMDRWSGIQLDNIIVMPATLYYDMEPVTEDKIKTTAELWNKVGAITLDAGVKLTCHHEFFCGIQSKEELDTFYAYTDPALVNLFVDTAQHCIASVDPVEFYEKYADRVTGFHFKDTRHQDLVGDYRRRPDAELMGTTTPRWFHEMGDEGGLVDFEAFMRAVVRNGYDGWLSVEHDKANKLGGDHAESTAIARWYAKNVLEKVAREEAAK
ncbi:sugar phosphate isomerase/epimerase family protein [Amnibacterium flavum]|nr:TIM barrel protein [Amnibacterium flavum]